MIPQRASWRRLIRLGGHSLASVVDQGAAAASNFLSSVFIGRLAGPEALGLFAMTGVVVMALRLFQGGAVLEPMSVFGPRRAAGERGPYLGFLLELELLSIGGVSVLTSIGALAAWSLAWSSQSEAFTLIASLVFANFILLQYLIRRQYYVDNQPYAALVQSLAYFAICLFGLVLYASMFSISVIGTYFVMTGCSIAVCVTRSITFYGQIKTPSRIQWRTFFWEHWFTGRWILFAVPVTIASYQGYFVLVGTLLSVEDAGRLKAVDSLVAPFQQIVVGLSMLLVPLFSRQYDTMTRNQRNRFTAMTLSVTGMLSLIYAGFLLVLGPRLLLLAYGNNMIGAEAAVRIMALVPICMGLTQPAAIRLLVARRTVLRFIVVCVAAAATLAAGIQLVMHGGLIGAAWGMCVSQAVCALGLWIAVIWLSFREGRSTA